MRYTIYICADHCTTIKHIICDKIIHSNSVVKCYCNEIARKSNSSKINRRKAKFVPNLLQIFVRENSHNSKKQEKKILQFDGVRGGETARRGEERQEDQWGRDSRDLRQRFTVEDERERERKKKKGFAKKL